MRGSVIRVGAFDCGTNSLRLLVTDLDPATGASAEHVREMRIVRLGQGVDRTGRIAEESMQRAYAALDEYAMLIEEYRPERIRFCATSAARDAENASDFTDAVRERIGVEVEVIGGGEEARASFDGATRALGEVEAPVLVLDIGGGSTELILGVSTGPDQQGFSVTAEHSLDIGSVRLTERHLHDDPPTPEQVAAAEADIDAALDGCRVDPGLAGTVVGVAGTVTTVAAGVLGLPAYDRERVHLARLDVAAVRATIEDLVAMTVSERRALGYMHPGRADVIGAGALILDRILRRTSVTTLTVSESDILDGIAWELRDMRTLISAAKNFLRHDDTDLAAMLTYYAVLAIFPGALALFSLIGLLGNPDDTTRTVLDILEPLMSADRLSSLEPTVTKLASADGASWTFALGTAGALYSASAYVSGFSRAMNRVREVEETRPFWKLRPLMLLITLAAVVLLVVGLTIVTVTGPLADSIGSELGVSGTVVDRWEIAKWPGLAIVVVVVVALLYHATPNVRVGRIRLLSVGAFLALLVWAAASTGFAFYVANFGSYNKTYGSVAGAIVALLWLWLTNVALMFGAEVDTVRDARIAEERAAAAAAAADLDSLDPISFLEPPRPAPPTTEKVVLRESFPAKPGQPPYGPVVQPVPEED